MRSRRARKIYRGKKNKKKQQQQVVVLLIMSEV